MKSNEIMKYINIRFFEYAWLGLSHCSEIFLMFSLHRAISQILSIIHLNLWCPIHVRFFSIFEQNIHTAFEFGVNWQAEFSSFHGFLIITHEIPHIFCVRTRWNYQNFPILTTIKSRLTNLQFYGAGLINYNIVTL